MRLGAGCWSKCGSRLTPCGQVTLFRNSSRMPLSMPFFFPPLAFSPPTSNPLSAQPSSRPQLVPGLPEQALSCSGSSVSQPLKSECMRRAGPQIHPLFCSFFAFSRFCPWFHPCSSASAPSPAALPLSQLPLAPPRSSAAGAGCAPAAHKSYRLLTKFGKYEPRLFNGQKNCMGFPAASSTPSLSTTASQANPWWRGGHSFPNMETSKKREYCKKCFSSGHCDGPFPILDPMGSHRTVMLLLVIPVEENLVSHNRLIDSGWWPGVGTALFSATNNSVLCWWEIPHHSFNYAGLKETIMFWHAWVLGVGKRGVSKSFQEFMSFLTPSSLTLPSLHRLIYTYISKIREGMEIP